MEICPRRWSYPASPSRSITPRLCSQLSGRASADLFQGTPVLILQSNSYSSDSLESPLALSEKLTSYPTGKPPRKTWSQSSLSLNFEPDSLDLMTSSKTISHPRYACWELPLTCGSKPIVKVHPRMRSERNPPPSHKCDLNSPAACSRVLVPRSRTMPNIRALGGRDTSKDRRYSGGCSVNSIGKPNAVLRRSMSNLSQSKTFGFNSRRHNQHSNKHGSPNYSSKTGRVHSEPVSPNEPFSCKSGGGKSQPQLGTRGADGGRLLVESSIKLKPHANNPPLKSKWSSRINVQQLLPSKTSCSRRSQENIVGADVKKMRGIRLHGGKQRRRKGVRF